MIFFDQNSWIFEKTITIMPHHATIITIVPMFSSNEIIRKKSDIQFLYYIVDINNLSSILNNGIVSRNFAIKHGLLNPDNDISDAEVQRLREKTIKSPYDKKNYALHNYANFYIQPNNCMLYAVAQKKGVNNLCVIKVSHKILNKPGAVMSLGNAACAHSKFFNPDKWQIPQDNVDAFNSSRFAGNHDFLDEYHFTKNKQLRQSEVLILDHISVTYIQEVIVHGEPACRRVSEIIDSSPLKSIGIRMAYNFSTSFRVPSPHVDCNLFPTYSTETSKKRKEPASESISHSELTSFPLKNLGLFPSSKKVRDNSLPPPISFYQLMDGARS